MWPPEKPCTFNYNAGIAMSYCSLMDSGEGSWNRWMRLKSGAQQQKGKLNIRSKKEEGRETFQPLYEFTVQLCLEYSMEF